MKASLSGRLYLLILLVCLAVSFACLAYPIYVIRPFRPQGPRELMLALAVTRFRPIVVLACAAAAVAALAWYWSSQRRLRLRIAASAGALVVIGIAVLTRINIYELMFHPLERSAFSAASKAKLDGDEMVITVQADGAARAYPIRILSYHHIVNDTLGGVPIVATY